MFINLVEKQRTLIDTISKPIATFIDKEIAEKQFFSNSIYTTFDIKKRSGFLYGHHWSDMLNTIVLRNGYWI